MLRCPSCDTTKIKYFNKIGIHRPDGKKEVWIKCYRCGFSWRRR